MHDSWVHVSSEHQYIIGKILDLHSYITIIAVMSVLAIVFGYLENDKF